MLSIFTIIVVLAYASFKFIAMISHEDYKVRTMNLDGFFEDTDPFDHSHGFMIAAGIFGNQERTSMYDYWEETRIEIPPEIGEFNIYVKIYDWHNGRRNIPIETEWCTAEDFDANEESNSNSRFYKTLHTNRDVIDYGPHLRCPVDVNNLSIYGNYETNEHQTVQVVFELCDPIKNF